jgi:hypothetical protein
LALATGLNTMQRFFAAWIALGLTTATIGSVAANQAVVRLALPEEATINLQNGSLMSKVQLTGINPVTKKITIQKVNESKTLEIKAIAKIVLTGKVSFFNAKKQLIFQGPMDSQDCGNVQELPESLTHFKLVKPTEAVVNIADVKRRKSFAMLAEDSTLVVEEIRFESANQPDKIVMKVKACRKS